VLIVHQTDQRLLLGGIGKEIEGSKANEESIRRVPAADPEGCFQRLALRNREMLEPIEDRCKQLMQAGEGEFHLGLHTGRAHDAAAARARLVGDVLQQRRLADVRGATDNDRAALAGADRIDHSVERVAFAASAREPV
jgi:hypothetical protein